MTDDDVRKRLAELEERDKKRANEYLELREDNKRLRETLSGVESTSLDAKRRSLESVHKLEDISAGLMSHAARVEDVRTAASAKHAERFEQQGRAINALGQQLAALQVATATAERARAKDATEYAHKADAIGKALEGLRSEANGRDARFKWWMSSAAVFVSIVSGAVSSCLQGVRQMEPQTVYVSAPSDAGVR